VGLRPEAIKNQHGFQKFLKLSVRSGIVQRLNFFDQFMDVLFFKSAITWVLG
jgi:hypothetical protein